MLLLPQTLLAVGASASCTIFANTDFDGHDLTHHPAPDAAGCCAQCRATSGCAAFTWMPEPKLCYMKASSAGRRPSPMSGAASYTSGCVLPGCATPPPPPPPPPLPRGGGACSSAFDCSLGGVCEGGRCRCDPQYTGPQCATLRLRRAAVDNGVQLPGKHTWGGHALHNGSKYVGFFSYMAGGCDLNVWQSGSMIIKAVADRPEGPYNADPAPVVGPWSHNVGCHALDPPRPQLTRRRRP